MVDVSFQLKGSVVTVVVLELRHYDPSSFYAQLQEKIDAAPQFFLGSALLINLEKLAAPEQVTSLEPIVASCRELGLLPVGFSGAGANLQRLVAATGLSLLPPPGERASKLSGTADRTPEPATEVVAEQDNEAASQPQAAPVASTSPARSSKVITRPVRSGQQVYAEGADLIVLSQVSEGAEVLADGHIHVYGPLRGRALAGVRGDTEARIFCQSLEAELVSVAGNFLLQDQFSSERLKKAAQISLSGESLSIEGLG